MTPEIERLYQRFIDKQCSREEAEQLLDYFRTAGGDATMVSLIEAALDKPVEKSEFASVPEFHVAENRNKLLQTIRQKQSSKTSFWLWSAAAAILIFLSVGIYWYNMSNHSQPMLTSRYGDDVLPGGNHAILTLADGSSIKLDSTGIGLLAQQHGINITKSEDGIITYEMQLEEGMGVATAALNTISTPRGGQYKVILPDGTQVWLNSASSLTYPIHFSRKERKVELEGEAYFDVAHNAQIPFIVNSVGQSIQVLGTQFNVEAYGDERQFTTTLVQGSVHVSSNHVPSSLTLKPGQQAVLSGGKFEVGIVDVNDYTAWKDGLIMLNNFDLPTVIKQLERWYDVEFVNQGNRQFNVSGIISRTANLSEVLQAIENNTGVKFRIEGRRVSVQE